MRVYVSPLSGRLIDDRRNLDHAEWPRNARGPVGEIRGPAASDVRRLPPASLLCDAVDGDGSR